MRNGVKTPPNIRRTTTAVEPYAIAGDACGHLLGKKGRWSCRWSPIVFGNTLGVCRTQVSAFEFSRSTAGSGQRKVPRSLTLRLSRRSGGRCGQGSFPSGVCHTCVKAWPRWQRQGRKKEKEAEAEAGKARKNDSVSPCAVLRRRSSVCLDETEADICDAFC